MSTDRSNDIVTVSDWSASYNIPDNMLVVSCTVSSADANHLITSMGLIVNNAEGATLASFYNGMSSGSEHVYPAFNLEPGPLHVGDAVWAVAQGECEGQHFFVEQELTIGNCYVAEHLEIRFGPTDQPYVDVGPTSSCPPLLECETR